MLDDVDEDEDEEEFKNNFQFTFKDKKIEIIPKSLDYLK